MNDSHKLYLAWRDAHEMMVEENAEAWAKNDQNFQFVLALEVTAPEI